MKKNGFPSYKNPPPPPPTCPRLINKSNTNTHKRKMLQAFIAGSESETLFGLWNIRWNNLAKPEKIRRMRIFLNWYHKTYLASNGIYHQTATKPPVSVVITRTFNLTD